MRIKLYLSVFLFLCTFLNIECMENSKNNIKLRPEHHFSYLAIKAYLEKVEAGSISYRILKYPERWELIKLSVEPVYRQKGIASALFTECIQDIQARQGTIVTWKALPLDPRNVPYDTLDQIYKKLINKLNPTLVKKVDYEEFDFRGFEYTTITLYLNKIEA